MEFINIAENLKPQPPEKGKLLIAGPFLNDSEFARTVVFMCEHGEEGSVGYTINQPLNITIGDLIQELEPYQSEIVVYKGGPVQPDTLHFLHTIPAQLGGVEVIPGIYWGGSFELFKDLVRGSLISEKNIRVFLGYSGWSEGQLAREMNEGTWFVGPGKKNIIFDTDCDEVWKTAIEDLGKEYSFLAHIPIDPQMN